MDTLITNQSELNYTEERRALLPDLDASALVREARKLQKPR